MLASRHLGGFSVVLPPPPLAANTHSTAPGDSDVKSGQDSSASPVPADGTTAPRSMPILPGRVKPGGGCRKAISTQFLVCPWVCLGQPLLLSFGAIYSLSETKLSSFFKLVC